MSTQSAPPARPERIPVNMVKWGLGCVGLGMVICTGLAMLALIIAPIVFRNLPGEWQDRFVRNIPITARLLPTHPPIVLPTSGASKNDVIALLASPTPTQPSVATPTQGSSSLSSGGDGLDNSSSSTPIPPTNTPQADSSNITPTPVINFTSEPSQQEATQIPTIAPTSTLEPVPVNFHNSSFKLVPQHWNDCGPANLTQALVYYGWAGTQEDAASYLKPNPADKNVSPWQMVDFVNKKTGVKALWRVSGDLNLVKRLVANKFAVIMETGYDVAGEGWMGHYLTVIGYDDNQNILYGMDTYLLDGKDHQGYREQYDDIDRRWQAFNRTYIVVYTEDRIGELAAILGPDADLNYNYEHARSVARYDASLQPNNAFAWFNLGSSLVLLHRYKEAVVAFDQAQNVNGLPDRFLWYQFTPYEAYYNTGNYANVLALVQSALNSTLDVEETYYWKAMAEAAMGQTASAEADFQRVLRFNPNFTLAADRLTELQTQKFAPPAVAQAGQ